MAPKSVCMSHLPIVWTILSDLDNLPVAIVAWDINFQLVVGGLKELRMQPEVVSLVKRRDMTDEDIVDGK